MSDSVHILDIRNCHNGTDEPDHDTLDTIINGLKAPYNEKSLPGILLWDERGLRLYDRVTTDASGYYLFGAESEILCAHASEIARIMLGRSPPADVGVPSHVLLELGAGSFRKTPHILHALADLVPENPATLPVTYFALDLEQQEIQRSLSRLLGPDVGSAIRGKIETKGLLGTYENCINFVRQGGLQEPGVDSHGGSQSPQLFIPQSTRRDTSPGSLDAGKGPQLHFMFLGSSLGNFTRGADTKFLRSLPLRLGQGDTLLLGLDHDNSREDVESAYNDPQGHIKAFVMNGLKVAGTALGNPELFDTGNWEYTNSYDKGRRAHEAYYKCLRPHTITIPSAKEEIYFSKDELVKLATSFKYSEEDTQRLFMDANLRPVQRWIDSTSRYSMWLLERQPSLSLLSTPATTAETELGDRNARN